MKTLIKKLYGWELTPWFGNPNLGIISYLKLLKNPFNGKQIKVWIWVSEDKYSYTVNARINTAILLMRGQIVNTHSQGALKLNPKI